jgi:hypothetical protein
LSQGGLSLGHLGLGHGQLSLSLTSVSLQGGVIELGQHLASHHRIAFAHKHLANLQATHLRSNRE